jgi:hypothetical protein
MMSPVFRNPQPADVPAAARFTSQGWRDPRLWVGMVLVAGSVVAGSAVMGSADDSTAVWAAARDLGPGEVLRASDLEATQVRFADAGDAARYLPVSEALPEDITLLRGVGTGELVAEAALGRGADDSVVVPVAVHPEHVPPGVGAGSRVDVWVVGEGAQDAPRAKVVLEDVAVVAIPDTAESFAASTSRQVVLAVPGDEGRALAVLLAASSEGLVHVVGRR